MELARAQVPSAFDYMSLKDARAAFEREYIGRKLREHGWNVSKTAEAIDTPRSNLYKKIEQYNIKRETGGAIADPGEQP